MTSPVNDILGNVRAKRLAAAARPDHNGTAKKALPEKPPERITALELFHKQYPPVPFVVEGLLGPGLTVLAGKPKGGKSWLALLVGWAVAVGADLDGRCVYQGDVLYLALEDTERRLQSRMRSLHAELNWPIPEALTIAVKWPRTDDRGLIYVAEWLDERKDRTGPKLVIVDVLAKFRKPQKGNGNSYADDYEAVGGLKELVDLYGASALYVHHTRKLKAADPFDELSGTYGISGPADTLWMLDRHETGHDARLYVRGRDVAECTIPIRYTATSGRWVLGESREGIDTEGRGVTGAGESRSDAARNWIRMFLRTYAYPARELDEAGRAAGHSPSAIKNAKNELGRQGTGELWFQKDGEAGWWVGLGRPATWKRRPAAGLEPDPRDEPVPD